MPTQTHLDQLWLVCKYPSISLQADGECLCCHIIISVCLLLTSCLPRKNEIIMKHDSTGCLSQWVTTMQQLSKVKTKVKTGTHFSLRFTLYPYCEIKSRSVDTANSKCLMRQKSRAVRQNAKCAINTHHANLCNIIGLKFS